MFPCVGCSLLEQKVNQLNELTLGNTRRLQEREDTALQYKRCLLGSVDILMSYCSAIVSSSFCCGSLMEQKMDQLNEMTTENTRRLQEREDTALQYKRCLLGSMDRYYADELLLECMQCPPCVLCSLMEQKIDHLTELIAENTQRLQEREDTALQYKRCLLRSLDIMMG